MPLTSSLPPALASAVEHPSEGAAEEAASGLSVKDLLYPRTGTWRSLYFARLARAAALPSLSSSQLLPLLLSVELADTVAQTSTSPAFALPVSASASLAHQLARISKDVPVRALAMSSLAAGTGAPVATPVVSHQPAQTNDDAVIAGGMAVRCVVPCSDLIHADIQPVADPASYQSFSMKAVAISSTLPLDEPETSKSSDDPMVHLTMVFGRKEVFSSTVSRARVWRVTTSQSNAKRMLEKIQA
jgi:hypothetical protein